MATDRSGKIDIPRQNDQSWDDKFQEVDQIYAEFQALGIPTVPASRIRAYREAFETLRQAAVDGHRLDQASAVRVLNALTEFHQLRTILKATRVSADVEKWRKRLHDLVSGSEMASAEGNHGSSRDFQFEMFVGAVCELAGMPVEFAEPDLVVRGGAMTMAIAAKRPRNRARIDKTFRKALQQVEQAGLPGLIAIDLSYALQAEKCINTNDLRGANVLVTTIADGIAREHGYGWLNQAKGTHVRGALLHLMMPAINFGHPEGPQLSTAIRWTIAPFSDWDGNHSWAAGLCRKLNVGLFGPVPS